MQEIITAFATDDGERLIDRHFGDANYYDLYRITPSEAVRITRIPNTSEEEQGHADRKKASEIMGLLAQEHTQMVVNRRFGPNIRRLMEHLSCRKSDRLLIEESIRDIQEEMRTAH